MSNGSIYQSLPSSLLQASLLPPSPLLLHPSPSPPSLPHPPPPRPADFGSAEYFSKDQHCENPNPDLLSRHGQPRKALAGGQGGPEAGGAREVPEVIEAGGAMGAEVAEVAEGVEKVAVRVRFQHVVEREYMVRICPCQKSAHCRYTLYIPS